MTPEESSALSFVFNTGIMRGRTEDKFYPYDPITRAEMAVVLNRTLATMNMQNPWRKMQMAKPAKMSGMISLDASKRK